MEYTSDVDVCVELIKYCTLIKWFLKPSTNPYFPCNNLLLKFFLFCRNWTMYTKPFMPYNSLDSFLCYLACVLIIIFFTSSADLWCWEWRYCFFFFIQESSEVEETAQLRIPRQCRRLVVRCLSPSVFTSHWFPTWDWRGCDLLLLLKGAFGTRVWEHRWSSCGAGLWSNLTAQSF